ncbi:MAG: O-antigen ligase domain-containing protein [Pedosphaera sp.]|nr:O-antigen ligase domain-containing protein [Pedosphaera sp.]
MTNELAIIRSLIIYSLCLPLAIFLGYVLAMPLDPVSLTIIVLAVSLPLIPVLLRWHHVLLVASWNMSAVLFFIPGRPNLFIALAIVSLTISILHQVLHRDGRFISVPSVTRPLILLLIVIVITAELTGGFGMRVTGGDSYGGKRYVFLLAAIAGYFAITYERVPEEKASKFFALYLLGSLTSIVGSIAPFMHYSLYFLFTIFPVENLQALRAGSDVAGSSVRLGGLAFSCLAVVYFVLGRHGISGLFGLSEPWRFMPVRFRGGFSINHPWRILIFLFMIWVGLLGGYRSLTIALVLTFAIQFYFEGMYRTGVLPVLVLVGILATALCLPMVQRLPITIQRSLSFLPIEVDPVAQASADSTSEWRLAIWRAVLPTVPQYLILGKGYSINPAELEMQEKLAKFQNTGDSGEGAILAGDYHNGPLSVIVPFGIFGAIAFLWFLGASFRVLLYNYRYGDAGLKSINTFLLSLFTARCISFFFVFGSLHSELASFTGIVALSICLNGGIRRPVTVPVEKPTFNQFKLARAAK